MNLIDFAAKFLDKESCKQKFKKLRERGRGSQKKTKVLVMAES